MLPAAMTGDDSRQMASELQELADETASAAASPIAAFARTDDGVSLGHQLQDLTNLQRPHSSHDFWGLTFILAAGIIVALAIVAAAGWIF